MTDERGLKEVVSMLSDTALANSLEELLEDWETQRIRGQVFVREAANRLKENDERKRREKNDS